MQYIHRSISFAIGAQLQEPQHLRVWDAETFKVETSVFPVNFQKRQVNSNQLGQCLDNSAALFAGVINIQYCCTVVAYVYVYCIYMCVSKKLRVA
jgi:hypothetical protein